MAFLKESEISPQENRAFVGKNGNISLENQNFNDGNESFHTEQNLETVTGKGNETRIFTKQMETFACGFSEIKWKLSQKKC